MTTSQETTSTHKLIEKTQSDQHQNEERNNWNQTKHYWILINRDDSGVKQNPWSPNIDIATKRWGMYHTTLPFLIEKHPF